jgi:hypothetical protein
VCPLKSALIDKKTGLCLGGFAPYTTKIGNFFTKPKIDQNLNIVDEGILRARNEWIMKYCPLEKDQQ